MQFGWTRRQKPTIGTQIDRTQSLANGLVWFAPLWEGGGQSIADVIGNVDLATYPTYAPVWSPASTPLLGRGPQVLAQLHQCAGHAAEQSQDSGAADDGHRPARISGRVQSAST